MVNLVDIIDRIKYRIRVPHGKLKINVRNEGLLIFLIFINKMTL